MNDGHLLVILFCWQLVSNKFFLSCCYCYCYLSFKIIFTVTLIENNLSSISPAVANFNLDSGIQHGLKLTVGDLILIYEQFGVWFRGCLLRDKRQVGIFPSSYVHMKEIQVLNVGNEDIVQPLEPSVAQEVTCTIREWHEQAKKLFLNVSVLMFLFSVHGFG